jgi:hypothetical protein
MPSKMFVRIYGCSASPHTETPRSGVRQFREAAKIPRAANSYLRHSHKSLRIATSATKFLAVRHYLGRRLLVPQIDQLGDPSFPTIRTPELILGIIKENKSYPQLRKACHKIQISIHVAPLQHLGNPGVGISENRGEGGGDCGFSGLPNKIATRGVGNRSLRQESLLSGRFSPYAIGAST